MEQPDRPTGISDEEWARRKAEVDITSFKNAVEDATVEEVDEPSGRKQVEIAWEDEDGFHVEEGEAYGVYREQACYHIDWTDSRGRTTIAQDDVVDLDEGEYYTE